MLVINKPLPLPSASKKAVKFFTKQVDFQSKSFFLFFEKKEEKFGRNKKALTFALPIKNGVLVKRQKIFESWETIALLSEAIREENNKVSQAKFTFRFDTLIF